MERKLRLMISMDGPVNESTDHMHKSTYLAEANQVPYE